MHVLPYASLDDVRAAIRSQRLIRFHYRKTLTLVEPHLLGHARRSHAFILCAWRIEPEPTWEHFRYAEMREVEILPEAFTVVRSGYNPYDRRIAGIDTCLKQAS